MTRLRYGIAALAAIIIAATGCTDPDGTQAERAAVAPEPEVVAMDGAAGERARDGSAARAHPTLVAIPPAEQALVYQARLTVRVGNVDTAAERAKDIVTGAGGYVAQEERDTADRSDRAVLTLKVPPQRYPEVLSRLGGLGRRESLHQSTEDVTEEVADVDSRVKSARSAIDRLRTLLTRANKIGEVLEIEREISNRQAELESLLARQKALAARTSMATITLTLLGEGKGDDPGAGERPPGFLAGLQNGWRALVFAAQVALTALGAVLPWAVVAAVAWLAVRPLLRRARRGTAPPAEKGPERAAERGESAPAQDDAAPAAGGGAARPVRGDAAARSGTEPRAREGTAPPTGEGDGDAAPGGRDEAAQGAREAEPPERS